MYSQSAAIMEINTFIQNIRQSGLHLTHVFLFGSYAQGTAHKDSDIDVALISRDFSGFRFDDLGKIAMAKIKSCPDIEVHTFSESDFTQDNPFAKEIIVTGLKII